MDETRMQHGSDWRGEDIAGWWLSEKLDGCRVYWDGASLWSRGGLDLAIPEAWRRELPAGIDLDGELYDGIGGVYRCGAAIRYGRFLSSMRFMIFDAPHAPGDWPQRMRHAAQAVDGRQVAKCVDLRRCQGLPDLLGELASVRARAGEGLMLRAPGLAYAAGRTHEMLKVKRIEHHGLE